MKTHDLHGTVSRVDGDWWVSFDGACPEDGPKSQLDPQFEAQIVARERRRAEIHADASRRRGLPTSPRQRGAEVELERLHVEELARLLGQAAELRWASNECRAAPGTDATRLDGELSAWRAALEDELRAARLDGARYSSALREVLASLASTAPCWPTARQLACVASSLNPSARRRGALARQALREGDFVAARAEFRAALACAPGPRLRRELELELRAVDEFASKAREPRELALEARQQPGPSHVATAQSVALRQASSQR